MIGIVKTSQALAMAEEAGVDLVEVAHNARPPVCRLMDYGKFRYQEQKEGSRSQSQAESYSGQKKLSSVLRQMKMTSRLSRALQRFIRRRQQGQKSLLDTAAVKWLIKSSATTFLTA